MLEIRSVDEELGTKTWYKPVAGTNEIVQREPVGRDYVERIWPLLVRATSDLLFFETDMYCRLFC